MVKKIVWGIIALGLYTAWCYLPAWQTPSQMGSSIESFLEHKTHNTADEAIRLKALDTAKTYGLELEKADVGVARESRPGQRVVNVRFAVGVPVSWLGQETVLQRPVEATYVYTVDEAAEESRLARAAEDERAMRRVNQMQMAAQSERNRRVQAECAKSNQYLEVTHVTITHGNGETEHVPCDAYRH